MSGPWRPGLFLRGMAMGAADVVPGVSGGTLALITGIYQELIDTLGGCLLYTSPSPRDRTRSRMPSSA